MRYTDIIDKKKAADFETSNMSEDLVGFRTELSNKFPELRYTSGYRKGATTKSGSPSRHGKGEAWDIENKPEVYDYLWNTQEGINLLKKYSLGILDETTKKNMKRTGATGKHFHIGKDSTLVPDMNKRYVELVSQPVEEVIQEEEPKDKYLKETAQGIQSFLKEASKVSESTKKAKEEIQKVDNSNRFKEELKKIYSSLEQEPIQSPREANRTIEPQNIAVQDNEFFEYFIPEQMQMAGTVKVPKKGGLVDPPKGKTVNYGTPEYEKAYRDGTFRDVPNQLDEVVINVNGKTGENIDKKYPYYGDLSKQDKEYFNDNGPIGASVRRRAKTKKPLAQDATDFVKDFMIKQPLSGLQVGQSAMVEVIEAARGNDYSMKNALTHDTQRVPSDTFLKDAHPAAQFAGDMLLDPELVYGIGKGLVKAGGKKLLKKGAKAGEKLVDNSIRNLEDLKYTKQFADKFGYDFPTDLERIAKSDKLTDMSVRGIVDRHNTFARGVSTNWKEIEKRNPEILRHLEGKGIDWQNNPQEAAEYMATHIPINTGYGRASLNRGVFERGEDALYSSNSFKTGEGYTYGDGYNVKAKRPTNYTSSNRRDWIDKNQLDYYERKLPSTRAFNHKGLEKVTKSDLDINLKRGNMSQMDVDNILKYQQESGKIKNVLRKKYGLDKTSDIWDPEVDKLFDKFDVELDAANKEIAEKIFKNPLDKKMLKTEAVTDHDVMRRINNDIIVSPEKNPELVKNYELRDKIQAISKEANEKFEIWQPGEEGVTNKKLWDDFILKELKDLDSNVINKIIKKHQDSKNYAHYIHIGTPGEKVLEVVNSRRVTPEVYKNRSRAHNNKYSKGLSAGALAPIAATIATKEMKEGKNKNK